MVLPFVEYEFEKLGILSLPTVRCDLRHELFCDYLTITSFEDLRANSDSWCPIRDAATVPCHPWVHKLQPPRKIQGTMYEIRSSMSSAMKRSALAQMESRWGVSFADPGMKKICRNQLTPCFEGSHEFCYCGNIRN